MTEKNASDAGSVRLDEEKIKKAVQDILASTPLRSGEDLDEAKELQYARLSDMNVIKKRRATIEALAEAAVTPHISRNDVFKRKNIVSKRAFYAKDKDWYYHPLFREVLEVVIALHERWDLVKGRQDRERAREEWRQKMHEAGQKMVEKAQEMMGFPLEEVSWEDEEVSEDGKTRTVVTIVRPANWSMATVPQLVNSADKVVRLALDMETDKVDQKVEVSGLDDGPIEIAQVEEDITNRLSETGRKLKARLLAKKQIAAGDDGETAVNGAGEANE